MSFNSAKRRFKIATRLEKDYEKSLRAVIKQINMLVKDIISPDMDETELKSASSVLSSSLNAYGEMIKPWAKIVATKMLAKIDATDEAAWVQLGKKMNRSLKKELQGAPTGNMLSALLGEQVKLITSLPLEAAERVHKMTLEGITTGERADSIAYKILKTGDVTWSRARCIARTEVSRTASGLTKARSEYVGSTHYYWRSSEDGDVRDSHKAMNGKICEFAHPPEVEPGKFYHAGMIYNCRCYMEPIIDEVDTKRINLNKHN